jgi:hypothetical protein
VDRVCLGLRLSIHRTSRETQTKALSFPRETQTKAESLSTEPNQVTTIWLSLAWWKSEWEEAVSNNIVVSCCCSNFKLGLLVFSDPPQKIRGTIPNRLDFLGRLSDSALPESARPLSENQATLTHYATQT